MPVSGNESESAASLRALFGRLVTRKVTNWTNSGDMGEDIPPKERMDYGANIVTSEHRNNSGTYHALLLDIDHPAWLVRSSTPGHFHLYIDVPGGIRHGDYLTLLNVLADVGVIERGYANASAARGFSSLRLPWIKKGQD
jgi:hypothetical protein